MTVIKEIGVMTRRTDWCNRDELAALIRQSFHPTPRSMRILDKAIWQPPTLDNAPDLGWDDRIWWKVPLKPSFDDAYKIYRRVVISNMGYGDTRDELLAYETWKAGYFQGQKLFKYLRKSVGVSDSNMDYMTTNRISKGHVWLCVSKNPIDLFFCATDQSFSSCMGMSSNYSGAFYMGLPGMLVEPSRYMVFIAPGKLHTHELHGKSFRHLKYLQRNMAHWGFK